MPAVFDLPVATLDVLGRKLGIDVRQMPLRIPFVAESAEQQRALDETAWRSLHQQNLAQNGRLHPDVEFALRTLAQSELTVVLMFGDDGAEEPSIALRASATPQTAVVVRQRDDTVRFHVGPTSQLVAALVSFVPDSPPLKDLQQVQVPRREAEEEPVPEQQGQPQDQPQGGEQAASAPAQAPAPAAAATPPVNPYVQAVVDRIQALKTVRTGFAQVIGHNNDTEIIGWTDTPEGRYVFFDRELPDGTMLDVYRAVDNRGVGAVIAEAITKVTR